MLPFLPATALVSLAAGGVPAMSIRRKDRGQGMQHRNHMEVPMNGTSRGSCSSRDGSVRVGTVRRAVGGVMRTMASGWQSCSSSAEVD